MTRKAGLAGLVGATAAALVFLALRVRELAFLCDDAFISFRYSRNLLEGHGLVFNAGEHVEGYTNFLWVLEVAGLWAVGLHPTVGAHVLSIGCTVAVLAVGAWWARSTPHGGMGPLVACLAVILLAVDRNYAVWATSGLETRQFTLLVTLGLALLPQRGAGPIGVASLAFAAASLTRPEGPLFFGVSAALFLLDRGRDLDRKELAALVLPFAAVVGGHLIFRVATYGDIVPNTYHAKHVRPWTSMGLRYLLTATIEGGWFLGLPLAVVGWVARAAASRRWVELAGPIAVVAHAVFVVRVGGDHFEFRMLDAWWPVLFLGVAEGACVLGLAISRSRGVASTIAAAAVALCAAYGSALEIAHDRVVARDLEADERPDRHVKLQGEAWLAWLPPLPQLLPLYDRTFTELLTHKIAVRHWRHREFCEHQLARYQPLGAVRGVLDLPDDAVDAIATVGVMPFYLPDLTVIDTLGLTDPVVAHNPVATPNSRRQMAHDRRPPSGYLQRRGVNMDIDEPVESAIAALSGHAFALQVAPELFVPFDSPDPDWAHRAFGERLLYTRTDPVEVGRNIVRLPDRELRGVRFLGRFDDGLDGWEASGDPIVPKNTHTRGQIGRGLLDSHDLAVRDSARASWTSPPFEGGELWLGFWVGGGGRGNTHVSLWADHERIQGWSGANDRKLHQVLVDLSPWDGRELTIVVRDNSTAPWGHIVADHFVLYRD